MKTAGWLVLLLVFVDEVLALVALGFWGRHLDPGWLWVWVLPLAGTLVWYLFASPKARWGHPVGRPAAKLLVFGVAAYGLWDLDHPAIALAFLVFSVVVNALAQVPAIAALPDESAGPRQSPSA